MKRLYWAFLMTLLVIFAATAPAAAASLESKFQAANASFGKGQYETALEQYEDLESLGVDSITLLYNRATTEARLGHMGMAVLYYERVLAKSPGHESAAYNLSEVRDFIARRANGQGRDADLAPVAGPWRSMVYRFTDSGAAISFVVLFALFFVLLIVRRFLRLEILQLSVGVLTIVLAFLWLLLGSVLISKHYYLTHQPEAIVVEVEDNVRTVYEFPGGDVPRYALEEGARVRIVDKKGQWVKILDDRGRDGWIPFAAVGVIQKYHQEG